MHTGFTGLRGGQYLHGHTGVLTIEVEDTINKGVNMTGICKGETTSTMNCIPGVETTTNYVTIYGTFPLRFMTNHLECKFNENEITIEVQYLLNISGEPQSQCTMFIHMSGEIE